MGYSYTHTDYALGIQTNITFSIYSLLFVFIVLCSNNVCQRKQTVMQIRHNVGLTYYIYGNLFTHPHTSKVAFIIILSFHMLRILFILYRMRTNRINVAQKCSFYMVNICTAILFDFYNSNYSWIKLLLHSLYIYFITKDI